MVSSSSCDASYLVHPQTNRWDRGRREGPGGASRPRLVEVPMVVRRPPMMHEKLNGMRNVEGANPLNKGSEGQNSARMAGRGLLHMENVD